MSIREQAMMKNSLEQAKTFLEIEIFKAQQAFVAVAAGDPAACAESQPLAGLTGGARKCLAVFRQLAAECRKWPSSKLTQADGILASSMVAAAEDCFDILAETVQSAESAARQAGPVPGGPRANAAEVVSGRWIPRLKMVRL